MYVWIAAILLLAVIGSGAAMAAPAAAPSGDSSCVSGFPTTDDASEGLLTQIIDYIKEVIDEATQELYEGITGNDNFLSAVNAAFILFLTFYGVAFMFGIVPLTLGQALVRLFKMGIILSLINEGFPFFREYVMELFNDGTDELIGGVVNIALGGGGPAPAAGDTPQPFILLEGVVQKVLSSNMLTTVIASSTTGPMGPAMGGLLGIGLFGFVQAIVKALRIYCIALVVKALLFGLAPIFISFILFERTKHIFTGWLNQLVNYSLQPLLMFIFISFFVVLMRSSVENILAVDICFTSFDQMSGATNDTMLWRFVDNKTGKATASDFTWNGLVSCIEKSKGGGSCPDFPISILDILTFLILTHLAWRFGDVVEKISGEIASSTLALDKLRSGMADALSQPSGGGGQPAPREQQGARPRQ